MAVAWAAGQHVFSGYRFVTDDATRASFEAEWGIGLDSEPGLRLPNMFDAALTGHFKGMYIMGEDPVQSDPNQSHIIAALRKMECVIVHDLFLNETAKYAHVSSCRAAPRWRRMALLRTPSVESAAFARLSSRSQAIKTGR